MYKGLLLDNKIKLGGKVTKVILNKSGNWKEYSPEHERQNILTETLMCATFSATDCIEYIFNKRIADKDISIEDTLWLDEKGYFLNGKINFNERFIGTLGETTDQGAYQSKIANAIESYGLIPQTMLPLTNNFYKNIDKQYITDEMYALGKEFKKRFPIESYGVGDRDMIGKELTYSPLQVCVYYADGDGILCPGQNPQHAVVCVNEEENYVEIDDSYKRQFKKYCKQAIWSIMGFKVNFKENKPMNINERVKIIKDKNSSAVGIWLPATSEEVLKSYCLNMNKQIVLKENGGIDWDNTIDGDFIERK